ncbi:MAG: hypothetical protein C5B47_08955 [Verrucomicrobia bacterium]|nr:MAG: hypothetical protein C5B47_08955 [Verrucomicrobiota bacterium]
MGFAKRDVNLAVIAQRLGISISTVSRALRGAKSIHPTTRERILEEAQALGYLDTHRLAALNTKNVLVLSQARQAGSDSVYMAGLSQAAITLKVSLISHHYMPENCHQILDPKSQPMAMTTGDTCGLILLHRWPEEVVRILSENLPVVSIVHSYPGVDCVGIEDRSGMLELVAHLVSGGRSQIGFFGFCPRMNSSCARFGAYVEALMAHHLPFQLENVIRVTAEEMCSLELVDVLSTGKLVNARLAAGVNAWICSNQMLAYSLCQQLQKAGFGIPEDVSLAGFHGNAHPQPAGLPILTTTSVNSEELGAAALKRVISRAEQPQQPCRSILFPCGLSKGESTRHV